VCARCRREGWYAAGYAQDPTTHMEIAQLTRFDPFKVAQCRYPTRMGARRAEIRARCTEMAEVRKETGVTIPPTTILRPIIPPTPDTVGGGHCTTPGAAIVCAARHTATDTASSVLAAPERLVPDTAAPFLSTQLHRSMDNHETVDCARTCAISEIRGIAHGLVQWGYGLVQSAGAVHPQGFVFWCRQRSRWGGALSSLHKRN
jgi:hypothetical protein